MPTFRRYISNCLGIAFAAAVFAGAASAASDETFGPPNLLKTQPTPFTRSATSSDQSNSSVLSLQSTNEAAQGGESPIRRMGHRSLADRLVQSRVYLPGRMVLGKPASFVIHGKPGWHAALAMADKDAGAKPIFGHPIHLGPDRKLVAVGVIPESGVLELTIETPIQGDLIGSNLFFEAALWSAPDFSDCVLATPITSEGQEGVKNGVLVAADIEVKKGVQIVPDGGIPLMQRQGAAHTLDSGRP
jgi:hypothetical protein